MIYRIPTRVVKIEEKEYVLAGRKDEKGEPVFTKKTLGWFVHFEGSYESLFVGYEKPIDLDLGSEVDILIVPRKKKQ